MTLQTVSDIQQKNQPAIRTINASNVQPVKISRISWCVTNEVLLSVKAHPLCDIFQDKKDAILLIHVIVE